MIGSIISVVGNLANTFLEGKVAKSKAKAEAIVEESKARAAIAQKKATGDLLFYTKSNPIYRKGLYCIKYKYS
jgi:hypothetical protein